MTKGLILKSILLLLAFHFSNPVFAQEYNYARMSLLYGGSIPFNFNSIKTYSEGIEILEGTILAVTLVDSNQFGTDLEGFELNFRTFNGQTEITGTAGTIPLNRIRIKAENYLGLGDGITKGYLDLSSSSSTLFTYESIPFSNLAWDTHQLSLSYECGKSTDDGGNGTLLGYPSDYYTVEIEVELVPTGPGF